MKTPLSVEYRIDRKWSDRRPFVPFATVKKFREVRDVLRAARPGMPALAARGGKMRVVKVTETVCG